MKKIIKIILLFFFTFFCERKIPNIIVENNDGGFVDLTLNISEININPDGSILITAESQHQQEKVGFQIELLKDFLPHKIDDEQFIHWGKGYFINTGKNTERFISLLANLYSVNHKQSKQQKIPVSLVYLSGDPKLLYSQPVRMKFFFNSGSDEEQYYAEVFINIDANKKTLEFHEKDEDYRISLINSLCGK